MKRFGDVVAVDGVDLDVREGEFFSMLGPSGSGKTTCLRMIAGFETPTAGRILLSGRYVTGLAPYERDVNTVFQDYALFPHMTVAENVGYGLMVQARCPGPSGAALVGDALEMVRLAGVRGPEAGSALRRSATAGGARARAGDPAEGAAARRAAGRARPQAPSGDADRAEGDPGEVGLTFIYVTHDQEEALTMSDRLAVFNRGRIEQVGSPAEVYERPATGFVAGFVGVSNVLEGEAAAAIAGDPHPFTIRPEKISMSELDAAVDRRLLHRDRPCAGGRVPGSHHPVHRRARSWAARSS